MKLFYDGLIYDIYRHRPGGISNFFDQLISLASDAYPSLLTSTRPAHLPHPSGKYLTTARFDSPIRPRRLKPIIQRGIFHLQTQMFMPSIIHPTYYRDPSYFNPKIPLIYTAFDMIHEKWSSQKDPSKVHASLKYKCFSRASAIPCISRSTQADLVELYPHLEDKTSVIYLSGSLSDGNNLFSVHTADPHGPLRYFLYVGDRRSYKNFTRALLAFASIKSDQPGLQFKIVGAPLSVDEQDLAEALGLEGKLIVCPDVTRDQLIALYNDAICLVYPSLYEGFGIPILEAMSLGVPVITSNTSSIPEVAGDAALYTNPSDIKEIRDSMLLMLQNMDLRSDLARRGLKRSGLFSWRKTADQYLDLYMRTLRYHNSR